MTQPIALKPVPDSAIVAELRDYLARSERGEFTALAIVALNRNATIRVTKIWGYQVDSALALLGGVYRLAHVLLRELDEAQEE